MKENQQTLLTLLILIVLILGVGVAAFILTQEDAPTESLTTSPVSTRNGFTTEELSPGSIEVDQIRSFGATFISLQDEVLTVRLESGQQITITTTEQTQFIQRIPYSPEEFEAKFQEFNDANDTLEPGEIPPVPPAPFREEQLDLATIQSETVILVQTAENARETRTLTAESIIVQETEQIPE